MAALSQLMQAPDPETLHDLRVGLRRLRALLRPLAGRKAFAPLHDQAGHVLALTNPLRDLEVLADELTRQRRAPTAAKRRKQFGDALPALLASPELATLATLCQPRPAPAPAIALPDRDALAKRCHKTLERDRERLARRLAAPACDLHRLRLDIKRLRYQLECQAVPGSRKEQETLVAAQALLGDWHDRALWLERAQTETDLRPCVEHWREEQAGLGQRLPDVLADLRRRLEKAAR